MIRPIKALSLASMILSACAVFLAVLFLTVFWKPICMMFASPEEALHNGPVIPIATAISFLSYLVFAILLVTNLKPSCKQTMEITIIVLLFVLPIITQLLGYAQSFSNARLGSTYIIAYGATNNALLLPARLASISYGLILLTCGMRIAEKIHFRNQYNFQR